MMTEQDVLEVLENTGAFRKGHFVFTSGLHGDTYINKDAVYTYTREISRLCREFAERFKDVGVEAVVGPAVGAALLSQWTAYHLSDLMGTTVYGLYADKDGQGGFVIKRGYDRIIAGKKALVIEDLTTTGGSVKNVVDAARAAGADIVGVAVLCNRGGVSAQAVGDPPVFMALVNIKLESWEAEQCPLCERGFPINTDVGHGKEFLAKKTMVAPRN